MKLEFIRNFRDFADLVLELHYKGKGPERIVEIVNEKENYDLSIDDVKNILRCHENGYIE